MACPAVPDAINHREIPAMTDSRPTVLFDGGCPLCRREIAHYMRLDSKGRIRWEDIHADREIPARHGLVWEDTMMRLHVVEASGRICTGAHAFAAIWDRLPGYRWLSRVLRAIPGMLGMVDAAYTRFARWRWRRRCETGTCDIR
jgi:predicted DCC family thiol-disulfide oxidoreductase YuxK